MTHLVLAVLFLLVTAARTCPPTCLCATSECLTSVPQEVQTLEIAGIELEHLPTLSKLQELTVKESVIDALHVSDLDALQVIRFRSNKIVDLELNVSRLIELDLANNSLTDVADSFRTLTQLQILNLSVNFLSRIDGECFIGLGALKSLDLSQNNLTYLNDSAFADLKSLQYLNLSVNRLEILGESCFLNLIKLQQLDLSYNRLIRVEFGSLQLPNLVRIIFTGNRMLGTAPVLLVTTSQKLQSVEASSIGLTKVPAALTHSIRTLHLVSNKIPTIRGGDLDSYPLLQLLDVASNNLQTIEDDALGRLDSLTILYLNRNNLTTIPHSLSEKLKFLHLEQNNIHTITNKDFLNLPQLEVLLLNDNKIQLIAADAFSQLTSLVTLDISRNPIKELDGCLSGSMSLEVLRLSRIQTLGKELLFPVSSTERIITLDLSGSAGLSKQFLRDTSALAAARQLQELDLSNTDLETVRSDLLHYLPQLRIIHLTGNRINCTHLHWLALWMRRQDEPEYSTITCASPPERWGTLLIDLEEEVDVVYTTTAPTSVTNDIFVMSFLDQTEAPVLSNASSQMSRFTQAQQMHLGLVVIFGGFFAIGIVFVGLAVRYRRKYDLGQESGVEVSSLGGVTDLW